MKNQAEPAKPYLVVDGHSVIHAWPDLKRLHLDGPRRHLAREALMQRLRQLQDGEGCQVVVVFDGTQPVRGEVREPDGLQILFAEAGMTADGLIERLVAKYAALLRMTVATADGMVRETILAHGAEWMSPEALMKRWQAVEGEWRKHTGRPS